MTRRLLLILAIFICSLPFCVHREVLAAQYHPNGTLSRATFVSSTLGEKITYLVYLPHGYKSGKQHYSQLYLLHGRGDNLTAWSRVVDLLDQMIAAGEIPPVIAIMPDCPWSQHASYYIDSQYTGGPLPGKPVESAFINDLMPHVDATYRTIADRSGRAIGGYSMGEEPVT